MIVVKGTLGVRVGKGAIYLVSLSWIMAPLNVIQSMTEYVVGKPPIG